MLLHSYTQIYSFHFLTEKKKEKKTWPAPVQFLEKQVSCQNMQKEDLSAQNSKEPTPPMTAS